MRQKVIQSVAEIKTGHGKLPQYCWSPSFHMFWDNHKISNIRIMNHENPGQLANNPLQIGLQIYRGNPNFKDDGPVWKYDKLQQAEGCPHRGPNHHYDDVTWTPYSIKSPAIRLLFNSVCEPTSKKHQSPHFRPLSGEFAGDRWSPGRRVHNEEKASIWWRHHYIR